MAGGKRAVLISATKAAQQGVAARILRLDKGPVTSREALDGEPHQLTEQKGFRSAKSELGQMIVLRYAAGEVHRRADDVRARCSRGSHERRELVQSFVRLRGGIPKPLRVVLVEWPHEQGGDGHPTSQYDVAVGEQRQRRSARVRLCSRGVPRCRQDGD